MEYSLNDFVEMFNNNDLDVEKYFGGYDVWFSILKKRGLMGEIDPKNAVDSEQWQNEYLLWLYDNDKPKYYEWVQILLSDISIEGENNKVYWFGERQDLSNLFCDGRRNDLSRETIGQILSGEGDVYEPYWETTDDVYRDVIEELNEENIKRLKDYIVEHLKEKQLSPETEEMELIASEQGHDDYWEINSENVSKIIDDEESMKSLLDDELSDLKSELYSIHQNSYNSAYEYEVYNSIWRELNDYFDGQGEWITQPHPYKKNTSIQKFKIPISDFEGIINDYLFENKQYGNSGTLEYHGSFVEIVRESKDCLSARIPDYPDFRLVDKNINEYFSDYI